MTPWSIKRSQTCSKKNGCIIKRNPYPKTLTNKSKTEIVQGVSNQGYVWLYYRASKKKKKKKNSWRKERGKKRTHRKEIYTPLKALLE